MVFIKSDLMQLRVRLALYKEFDMSDRSLVLCLRGGGGKLF